MNTDTAVVICAWNRREDLLKCLASIASGHERPDEVIVVDNASVNGTASAVRQHFPDVRLIVNAENLGGSGGFNTGLRRLLSERRARHVWLLDSDVTVAPGALAALRAEVAKNPSTAIVGSLILRRDAPDTVQELGARIDFDTFEYDLLYKDHPMSTVAPQAVNVNYVPACSLLVNLEKASHVGLMDEGYFLYFDDIDWCTRMKRAGYRVIATPASRVWHREGGRNRASNLPVYYWWRNAFHFFMQGVGSSSDADAFLRVFLKRAFVAMVVSRRMEKPNSYRTLVSAIWDALLGRRGPAPAARELPLDPGLSIGNGSGSGITSPSCALTCGSTRRCARSSNRTLAVSTQASSSRRSRPRNSPAGWWTERHCGPRRRHCRSPRT